MRINLEKVEYRPARYTDAADLFEIKNDPDVRRFSIVTKDRILWENHIKWLTKKLKDESVQIYCIVYKGFVLGDVRLDLGKDEIEVSIRLLPQARGQGVGSKSVRRATEHAERIAKGRRITAKILANNVPSMRTFKRVGFVVDRFDREINYMRYV